MQSEKLSLSSKEIYNPADLAEHFINHTHENIFLTGKAGTGKTTFLKHIIDSTHKKALVTAPTGIAALNAGGVTLHSQFQLPFGGFLPTHESLQIFNDFKFETKDSILRHLRMSDTKRKTIREAELLIIDEASMLRADLLDAIDFILQHIRRKKELFGGLQILFIGDLLQLPPVVKPQEWEVMKTYYDSPYFFDALALKNQLPIYIELEKIYRQTDPLFTHILSNLRHNELTKEDVDTLNAYYQPQFAPSETENYITLTTHNRMADAINHKELNRLVTQEFLFQADIHQEFSENIYPCEAELKLKKGAQVMFIKNDMAVPPKFFNGKLGRIVQLDRDKIVVETEDKEHIYVSQQIWKNIRYRVNENTKEIEEEVIGTFAQFPLRLAWAITIHKSQGLTFEKAILDVQQVFASGQAYVAFSRLKSLSGLVLSSLVRQTGINNPESVLTFENTKNQQGDLQQALQHTTQFYLEELVAQTYDFSDLKNQWRFHLSSYNKEDERSVKQQQYDWALQTAEKIFECIPLAEKFLRQMRNYFSQKPFDASRIAERLVAACQFFEPKLKSSIEDIIIQQKKIAPLSKTKLYQQELEELDSFLMNKLRNIYKVALLSETFLTHQILNKSVWEKRFDISWRKNSAPKSVQLPPTLKTKKERGTTYKETLLLFKEGKSVEEIANIRSLTVGTVEGHLTYWIKEKVLHIEEVISHERYQAILSAIKNTKSLSVTDIKMHLGASFSFGEIRIALAAFIPAKVK